MHSPTPTHDASPAQGSAASTPRAPEPLFPPSPDGLLLRLSPEWSDNDRWQLSAAQRALEIKQQNARLSEQAVRTPRPFVPPPFPTNEPPAPQTPPIPAPSPASHAAFRVPEIPQRGPDPGTPAARAERAVQAARERIETLRRGRWRRATLVYRALVLAGFTLLERRGTLTDPDAVTFFTVVDVIPLCTGLSRDTVERGMHDLRAIDLISTLRVYDRVAFRDQQGGVSARTGCQGVYVSVVLRPAPGRRALIRPEELPPGRPRDLQADRDAGRTAWQLMQANVRQSPPAAEEEMDIAPMLLWSLPQPPQNLGVVDYRTPTPARRGGPDAIWSLTGLMSVATPKRPAAIAQHAAGLAALLRDGPYEPVYRRLLRRAVDAEYRGVAAIGTLQHTLARVGEAMREGVARRPGALLRALLRREGWLDAVNYWGTSPAPPGRPGHRSP